MRDERTPTEVMVTKLDLSSLDEAMTEWYHEEHPDDVEAHVRVTETHGFVETPAGTYVLGTEGVGSGPHTDDEKIEFYGYASRPGSFSVMPSAGVAVTVGELKTLATDERVNLADFVRTFGARLDNNYELHREAIETGTVPA